ncbi:MAG: lanthionine synthetase LanC family protein [Chloroflexota bacterium]
MEVIDTPKIYRNIAIEVQTTSDAELAFYDHLCCGNWGMLETLNVAAQKNMHPCVDETLAAKVSALLARAGRNGRFYLPSTQWKHPYQIGLWQGTAGIGYQLLRIARPNDVPSLLLWE